MLQRSNANDVCGCLVLGCEECSHFLQIFSDSELPVSRVCDKDIFAWKRVFFSSYPATFCVCVFF